MVPNEHKMYDMTKPELGFAVSFSSAMPLMHAIAISVQAQRTQLLERLGEILFLPLFPLLSSCK